MAQEKNPVIKEDKYKGFRGKKKLFLSAFDATLGNITSACEKAFIGRSTYYRWYKNDPKFKEAIDNLQESTIDYVESKLLKTIKDDNVTAMIFYLKTKGRHRGYVEKVEQEVTVNPFLELMQAATSSDEDDGGR